MTDREKAIKDLEDIIATAEGIKGLSEDAGITISLDKIDSLRFALESLKADASDKTDRGEAIATLTLSEVEYADAITEEEIVKPYLEKLKTEIAGLKRFELRGTITPLVNVDRAIELIDNLLTEKGTEE